LKKSTFICIYDLNVPILNTNPKTREEVLASLDADKWIKVMKAKLDAQYRQGTFKLDILSLRRKLVHASGYLNLRRILMGVYLSTRYGW
jgi:hypothetical protein